MAKMAKIEEIESGLEMLLDHLQMAQQIAIFSYFAEPSKKNQAPIHSLSRS